MFAASLIAIAASPIVRSEFVYEKAPFPSCHAATLAETSGHKLICAWFGGTAESNPDVEIYVSRLENGAWSEPDVAADGLDRGRRFACYNPVLFQVPRGPLLLFFKYGTGPSAWKGRMTSSKDDGAIWAPYSELSGDALGPIKNKPLWLGNGAILCPSSTEDHGWRVRFERSQDEGKTWMLTDFVNDGQAIQAIQPSLLPLGGKRYRAIGRTKQGKLFAVDSPDQGATWGPMRLLDVPNPNSGIDAVRLKDGRFLLVYNNATTGRTPLTIALSTDAETWRPVLNLEDSPGEYSYPAVIQTSDGLVHVAYTWNRKRIKHVALDPKLLP
jgi:predicted neuraminidase